MARLIDDFTTGPGSVTVDPVRTETVHQSGAMLGGARRTTVNNAASPRGMPARLDLGGPARLSLTLGAMQSARLDVAYGWRVDGTQAPLGIDLREHAADRFVTTIVAKDESFSVNFNIVVFAAGGWSRNGKNVGRGPVPFLFADFDGPGGRDFGDVSAIAFVFQANDDLAIDRLEIV
jgi:hypothetical protein